jgi:methylenetetrahydrofolate reductase (NADPH)
MTFASPLPLSLEFFPPKSPEGAAKLAEARQKLYALQPEFCSVTYGAGGSTQGGTMQTVRAILEEGHQGAPHFSCIGASRESVREKLATFRAAGIRRVVALRGDLPSGYGDLANGPFRYASDLVAAMCRRLVAGGAGELHFYTLNLARPTEAVLSRLD